MSEAGRQTKRNKGDTVNNQEDMTSRLHTDEGSTVGIPANGTGGTSGCRSQRGAAVDVQKVAAGRQTQHLAIGEIKRGGGAAKSNTKQAVDIAATPKTPRPAK